MGKTKQQTPRVVIMLLTPGRHRVMMAAKAGMLRILLILWVDTTTL